MSNDRQRFRQAIKEMFDQLLKEDPNLTHQLTKKDVEKLVQAWQALEEIGISNSLIQHFEQYVQTSTGRALFEQINQSQPLLKTQAFLDGKTGEDLQKAVWTRQKNVSAMTATSALVDACEEGNMEEVKELLNPYSINYQGSMGVTPLMTAVKQNNKDLVELLLSYDTVDINKLNAGGVGALSMACRIGHTQMVDLLLQDNRTDVNLVGKYGGTALHNAAGFGYSAIVQKLLDHGAIIQAGYTDKKLSPIDVALQNGHAKCVDILKATQSASFATTQKQNRIK